MVRSCLTGNCSCPPCLKEWVNKKMRLGKNGSPDARNLYKEEDMLTGSAKAKGRRGQQKVVRWILDCFPSLEPDDVRSTPMGVSGPDVQLSPRAKELFAHSIEVKNQEKPSLRKSWEQADANSDGCNPLLFTTWNRGPELVTMKVSYYFNLIKEETNEQSMEQDDEGSL